MIAIVIPLYERKEELLKLIESITKLDAPEYEVIIVNNSEKLINYIHDPSIHVIDLGRNYGATAGFNAGMRYVLEAHKYDYVWLLDSDLTVHKDVLKKLYRVINSDERIGIAGPKILNSQNPELIVEVGAHLDINNGNIFPVKCNEPDDKEKKVKEVDYLGSGISLIRVEALKRTGLMDERYYFLWDDIDFCLRFRKNGYSVVAVPDAVVYHPPFTEKRNSRSSLYYGIRNMLFLVSRHGSISNIVRFNYFTLRKNLKNILFATLRNDYSFEKFMLLAYRDFILGRLGEGNFDFNSEGTSSYTSEFSFSGTENAIIFSNVSSEKLLPVLKKIREMAPGTKVQLLCRENRKNIFSGFPVKNIITYDDKKGHLLVYLELYFKLIKGEYDLAINPDPGFSVPYQYIFSNVICWDETSGKFHITTQNKKYLWKLLLAVFLGEVLSVAILPFLAIISLKNKIINSV